MHELSTDSSGEDFELSGLDSPPPPSTIGQPLVLNYPYVDPPPYLDVLSFQSTRLLPISRKEIELQQQQKKNSQPKTSKHDGSPAEEEAARLDELLATVHLLLEPIQLPDLSHTGVFDPATSLLRPATPASSVPKSGSESPTKLKLSKLDKSDEVKLFYPTGAKNSNMREVIKETIQKHFSTVDLEQPLSDHTLGHLLQHDIVDTVATAGLKDFYLQFGVHLGRKCIADWHQLVPEVAKGGIGSYELRLLQISPSHTKGSIVFNLKTAPGRSVDTDRVNELARLLGSSQMGLQSFSNRKQNCPPTNAVEAHCRSISCRPQKRSAAKTRFGSIER